MKIAILGGTGALGRGLAYRLAGHHDILIGSRNQKKGEDAAAGLSDLTGRTVVGGATLDMARLCDEALLTMSYDPEGRVLSSLRTALAGKLVISPIVPMSSRQGRFVYALDSGSAAEQAAAILGGSRVASSLHTVPAPLLLKADDPLNLDALVAADSREVFEDAASLIRDIGNLRPLYAGPLSQSRSLEVLVPLLLNLARLNGLHNLSIRFV